MPTGMEFLLQSIGIDPAAIQATISEVQKQFTLVNERLQRMEDKLDAALASKEHVTEGVTNGNSDSHPGAGAVSNQPANGAPAGSGSDLSTVTSTVTATIGGQTAQVPFAGLAPGFVGLWQANVVVPSGLAKGDFPLIITVGGQASNSADVSVTP